MELDRINRSQTTPVDQIRKFEFENSSEEETHKMRGKQVIDVGRNRPHKAKSEDFGEEEEKLMERKNWAATAEELLEKVYDHESENESTEDRKEDESMCEPVKAGKQEDRRTGKDKRSRATNRKPRKYVSDSEGEDDYVEENLVKQTRLPTAKKVKKKVKNRERTANLVPSYPPGIPPYALYQAGQSSSYPPGLMVPAPAGLWMNQILSLSNATSDTKSGNDYSINVSSGNSTTSTQSKVRNNHGRKITSSLVHFLILLNNAHRPIVVDTKRQN